MVETCQRLRNQIRKIVHMKTKETDLEPENNMRTLRNRICNYVGFSTMDRLFELEGERITNFFINGLAFCIAHYCDLKYIDSTRRNFANKTNKTVIRIEDELSYLEDLESLKKIEVTEVNGFYKVRLFHQIISMGQVHLVYLYIKKTLIK